MYWYGDPDDLDRLALRLSRSASRLRDRAEEVRVASAAARWRGPAADAFHASVSHETGLLQRSAGELEDAAALLHRHADAVRVEVARLVAAERAAHRLVSAGLSTVERLMP